MEPVGSPRSELELWWDNLAIRADIDGYSVVKRQRRAGKANGSTPPPSDLVGDIDQVRECLAFLPNKPGNARDREEWVSIVHAIVAATSKSGEGKIAALEWSADFDPSEQGMQDAERLWEGIDLAACRVGIRYLATLAQRKSEGRCTVLFDLDFGHPAPVDLKVNLPAGVELVQPAPPTLAEITYMAELATPETCGPVIAAIAAARPDPVDVERLLKELKDNTGLTLGTLRRQLAAEHLRNEGERTYDVPRRLADAAHGQIGKGKLAFWHGLWRHFNGKYWEPLAGQVIERTMNDVAVAQPALMMSIGDSRPQNIRTAVVQAMGLLAADVHDRLAALDRPEAAIRPIINVNNGTLHVSTRDGAVTFKPHDPADCLTYVCDVDYDPHATCARFDNVILDLVSRTFYSVRVGDAEYEELMRLVDPEQPVLLDDGRTIERGGKQWVKVRDPADNVRVLMECMAYTLTPWRAARCFIIFLGGGANGKTSILRTIQRFLPPAAVLTRHIAVLDTDTFIFGQLAGKLAWIDDDAKSDVPLSESLKLITEPKPLSPRIMHTEETHSFISTVVPIMAYNSPPIVRDLSAGMRSRMIALSFDRSYKAEIENGAPNPWDAILEDRRELSGIFNRLLGALASVIQHRRIGRSRAADECFHRIVEENAPEQQFIREWCIDFRPDGIKSNGDYLHLLYRAFTSWYADRYGGVWNFKLTAFRRRVEQFGFDVHLAKGRARVQGLWLNPTKVNRGDSLIPFTPLDVADDEDED